MGRQAPKACLDKYDYIVDVNIPININCTCGGILHPIKRVRIWPRVRENQSSLAVHRRYRLISSEAAGCLQYTRQRVADGKNISLHGYCTRVTNTCSRSLLFRAFAESAYCSVQFLRCQKYLRAWYKKKMVQHSCQICPLYENIVACSRLASCIWQLRDIYSCQKIFIAIAFTSGKNSCMQNKDIKCDIRY